MATTGNPLAVAAQARRTYIEGLVHGMPAVWQAVLQGAMRLLEQPAETSVQLQRRDLVADLRNVSTAWLDAILGTLREAQAKGKVSPSRFGALAQPPGPAPTLSLVDDDTMEREIVSSRLALAMMDRASWEFNDLRSRITVLEHTEELDVNDMLRPHVLARIVVATWRGVGLDLAGWRALQPVLHDELAHFVQEAYHETNRWLIQNNVLPEIDLRPYIRRTRNAHWASAQGGNTGFGQSVGMVSAVGDETRLMTRAGNLAHGSDHAQAVLGRLNRLIGRQLPGFARTTHAPPASGRLQDAITDVQQDLVRRLSTLADLPAAEAAATAPALLQDLQQRKQALKKAAETPVHRATIEIVALLFQSILTEERIPATVRVWFARLQMPVLRVAIGEPDFFATTDHPARRLIDRMGACVMGFDSTTKVVGDVVEKEIKRIVQVVEAYPDTGRRVFQTVLNEFEKFLEHYFRNENEASRKGVSLAQQVEQRETMAIQYTIELRKMLDEMPVQEGIREFLFQAWADVLAMTAIKFGAQSDEIKTMKRAAADLIWSAGAKASREERAEVIRRLPPLLKTLREGMNEAGVSPQRQDEYIQRLNNSLAAAFTAKAAAIPHERLQDLMTRLDTLEELLPDASDVQIDESLVLDLSGQESSELEVVAEGGSMPTPAMLSWARELQVGGWYMLDYRDRNEAVQLAWQGQRRHLTLFVSPQGRGILFQQHRLAAFLQAGLLVPAQEESLTVRATRSALAVLDGDPGRLLN